jgi:probable F420-dependent oxidoreductase
MPTFGTLMFMTEYTMQPVEMARAVEERGLDSLFLPEHSHMPTSVKTTPEGGAVAQEYSHLHDPFVALTAAAAATRRIKIGTGVCLVIERDPIVLAKQVASLDMISNGRFMFAVGAGWNGPEMENHGTPFRLRWRVLRERILALKEIWSKEAAEFHGQYVNFDSLWSWPKPVQAGGPPVLLGSQSMKALDRVVEYCDGWAPRWQADLDFEGAVKSLRESAARRSRPFGEIQLVIFIGAQRNPDVYKRFLDLGFTHFVARFPSVKADQALPQLDQYAELAVKLR